MNSFFKKGWLITILVLTLCFTGAIIYKFASLSFTPVNAISGKRPETERGAIVDRSGAPLAVQTTFYHIGVNPKQIKNKESFAEEIAPALEMEPESIINIIENSSNPTFVYLRKKIDQNMFAEVRRVTDKHGYNFVSYDKIPGRIYPNHSLASQLIGYMGDDGKGLAGMEYSQQDVLSPDSQNPDESGKNIYLTIDANLQYKLEQVAFESMKETQAESLMMIAANSRTGEILSYISLPECDLNDYGSSSTSQKIDRPAMTAYEPGSVFKIFTVAMLYDENRISANDSFLCDGMYEHRIPKGETVRIKCLEHHGWITPRQAISYSCNDAIGQISDRIDEDHFMEKIRQLGFGSKTGVELPGETAGSVKETSSRLWSARSKPTIAIGQEISVSALQMVQAATAIANFGVPVKLTFINKITNKDGSIYYQHTPQLKERIFSKNTADYVLDCMHTTAESGNGMRANIRDISIGVKTGTAQMADKEKGGYSDTDFISSCMAIFPTENPEIVLYVVIEKAKGETYGGRIAAPVIAKAADIIIDHMGMSRGDAASLQHNGLIKIPSSTEVKVGAVVPDFTGMNKRELAPVLEREDIRVTINGSGWVKTQNPEPGTPITENMTIELNLE